MNDRERWIVYPLLFLALGAALRDKLAKQTSAKQIVCERLYLVDAEGRPKGVLTGEGLSFEGKGIVQANTIDSQAYFQNGRPLAEATGQLLFKPFLQFFSQLANPQAPRGSQRLRVVPTPQPPAQPKPAEEPDAEGPQLAPPSQGEGEPAGAA
ncbi:hypothetical protein MalM25_32560 [Planctomycetes bacterium MalM25]|nr:hypothetical protein MalM25_32560 [Planctomycetes bacterium MalM25]